MLAVIRRLLSNRVAEYRGDELKSIHAPTLIVWGIEDALAPVKAGEKFHAAITGSQMVIIDKSGHLPPAEKPSEFNKALLEFLTANR